MLANQILTNQAIQITFLFWRNKYIEKKKLNHLSKKNNSASHNEISNVKANIKSAHFELMTDTKSTKNKTKKSNTENVQHEKKKLWHTSIQSNLPHYKKNAANASAKENTDNSEDNSSAISCDIISKSKK